MPLHDGRRIAGRVTSAAVSPALGATIGLGWVRARGDGGFPSALRAGPIGAEVAPTPFYDRTGERLDG
jgi:glycine cleavage system aminomethyltransferase T